MKIRYLLCLSVLTTMAFTACDRQSDNEEIEVVEAPVKTVAEEKQPPALPRSASPEGARVFFVNIQDGAEMLSPVTLQFGIEGMTVAPAGQSQPNSGHHHLLINVTELPDLAMPVPNDANHRHFGAGQTETTLELEPGKHTLQLLLGDHNHIPHDPPVMSEKITILVKPAE